MPIDLNEYEERRLVGEIDRRASLRAVGLCDYCEREPSMNTCKFPERHRVSRYWPKYEIVTNGISEFLPLGQAGVAYDNGWAPVEMGSRVEQPDGVYRPMTVEDRRKIVEVADDYSGSK